MAPEHAAAAAAAPAAAAGAMLQHERQSDEEAEGCGGAPPAPPRGYLLVHNVTKRANVGTLIRSCAAFSCDMFIIGSREFNTFGSHGSDLYVRVGHAPSVNDAVVELKERRGVEIVGVEIDERAINLYDFEWRRDGGSAARGCACSDGGPPGGTAFLLGNEGHGLSDDELAICDRLVYIPQYGAGTASLNVAVAASIVLAEYARCMGFAERGRHGAKFDVGERPRRTTKRGCAGGLDEAERRRRATAHEANDSEEELAVLEYTAEAALEL